MVREGVGAGLCGRRRRGVGFVPFEGFGPGGGGKVGGWWWGCGFGLVARGLMGGFGVWLRVVMLSGGGVDFACVGWSVVG